MEAYGSCSLNFVLRYKIYFFEYQANFWLKNGCQFFYKKILQNIKKNPLLRFILILKAFLIYHTMNIFHYHNINLCHCFFQEEIVKIQIEDTNF